MGYALDKYLDIPFVDGGRSKEGCDCWGLIMILYRDLLKIELPDFPISSENCSQVHDAMVGSIRAGQWIRTEEPSYGDIIAMALSPRNLTAINHVGMFICNNKFIHSIQNQRSAICSLDSIYWKNRIKGFYRWQM
jgi:cell wall-associated NlpC family hydrolase